MRVAICFVINYCSFICSFVFSALTDTNFDIPIKNARTLHFEQMEKISQQQECPQGQGHDHQLSEYQYSSSLNAAHVRKDHYAQKVKQANQLFLK